MDQKLSSRIKVVIHDFLPIPTISLYFRVEIVNVRGGVTAGIPH